MRFHKSQSLEIALRQAQESTLCPYSWEDESCLMETGCSECHRHSLWLADLADLGIED